MRKGLVYFVAALIAATVVISAGLNHYDRFYRADIERPSEYVSFQLLDVDRNLLDFKTWQAGKKTWIIYLPDDQGSDAQEKFAELVHQETLLTDAGWQLLFISRLDIEYLFNLRRVSGLKSPILADPSGSVLTKMGGWKVGQPLNDWLGIWVDSAGRRMKVERFTQPSLDWLNKN